MQNSKAKYDEIKLKFKDLLNVQGRDSIMIPSMGFSEYFITDNEKSVKQSSESKETDQVDCSVQESDQEILESIEDIYFQTDTDSSPATYELQKVCDSKDFSNIDETMTRLRKQQKVLSKQVLQNILTERNKCNAEFCAVVEIQRKLEESLWTCRKARSYLKYAKTNLTTTSLEILASYRKREILKELLQVLFAIRQLKSTDVEVQNLLSDNDYSGAISLLLNCINSATAYMEYQCVQSLHKKLQETLLLTEFQLDIVLNEMVLNFDVRTYVKLMEAYKLLNKSLMAMDQLHINFISSIHSTVNAVLRSYIDPKFADENVKLLYEQLCEQVATQKYLPCLVSLCKTTWTILASYYQIIVWHQNYKLYATDMKDSPDSDIQEKLLKGQSRIWNDILSKICIFLQSSKLTTLKYDQFIQVLSIVQRLKNVGAEFCGTQSEKLIEIMQNKSEEFFQQYHTSCLEEICLFLDNESWTVVESFTNILSLQEFRNVKNMLHRQKRSPIGIVPASVPTVNNNNNNHDEEMSVNSQDGGSSVYGSYGYFLRFSEKSSPFDGGLDVTMLEEDILSGIVDEASCYFSESDDEQKSLPNKDEESVICDAIMVNSTTLNVFRIIGRYLQMCKLLHSISPKIVMSMLELIDFYVYAVHEIFGKDAAVQMEKFYAKTALDQKLKIVESNILVNIRIWPLNFSSLINNELANPDTLYGLAQRVVAVESCQSLMQQFRILQSYLNHLLPLPERPILTNYLAQSEFIAEIAQPVYTCVTSRVVDISTVLNLISKIKWDINHVSFQHNSYIDIINRNTQNFAMGLEDVTKSTNLPSAQLYKIWNSLAHVVTHLLVEGFSNVKKCSAGGRALMQLDFTNFMSFFELISSHKFPEHASYVDNFIKSYYYSNEQFEEWIEKQVQEEQYSKKQLENLIQCVFISDKRAKQRLLNLLGSIANTSLNASNIAVMP